ncbi:hypothetical protein OAE34_03395 [Akkermansiaceae bacterium]|nr:hypothetical protein [Akkermansiaceae bacterium]
MNIFKLFGRKGFHVFTATAIINIGQTKPENLDAIALASWTTVSRAILNLSETTTRN